MAVWHWITNDIVSMSRVYRQPVNCTLPVNQCYAKHDYLCVLWACTYVCVCVCVCVHVVTVCGCTCVNMCEYVCTCVCCVHIPDVTAHPFLHTRHKQHPIHKVPQNTTHSLTRSLMHNHNHIHGPSKYYISYNEYGA